MFYKFEKLTSATIAGRRMHAGAKTPWWREMTAVRAYYDPSFAGQGSYFELMVYPEAGRALLTGYYNGKTKRFSPFVGQVDVESQIVGAASWRQFLEALPESCQ